MSMIRCLEEVSETYGDRSDSYGVVRHAESETRGNRWGNQRGLAQHGIAPMAVRSKVSEFRKKG